MKSLILSFLGVFTLITSYGQSKPILAVDSLLTEMANKDSFSGSILIADNARVLIAKGYGYSDRENKIKNTADTRFDLSSASKIFVGTAITELAQRGKLKFTDTIGKYIKGLPQGNKITIHQILTHSSGFNDFWKAKGFSYKNIKNCTDVLSFMRQMPLVYNPGDSCIYSTGNPIILGAVIEKITGMDFQDYIQHTFIKSLALNNTLFTPYWTLDESQRQYAIGYRGDSKLGYKKNHYNYDNGSIPLSAGGAWSSVIDLYKFDKAVLTGKLLRRKFLRKMIAKYTPQWETAHFGYIWINSISKNGYESVGHPGNSSGWNAMNSYYPKQKYTVIILTNFGTVDVFKLSETIETMLFQ